MKTPRVYRTNRAYAVRPKCRLCGDYHFDWESHRDDRRGNSGRPRPRRPRPQSMSGGAVPVREKELEEV